MTLLPLCALTSHTVAGVVYVVDSGMVKQKNHVASSGMDSLDVVPVSRVAATQRAGRAGRTQAGKVRQRLAYSFKHCLSLLYLACFLPVMPSFALPHLCAPACDSQCFRLYTRQFFDRQMPDVSTPEIQRTSLAGAVLYLKTLSLDVDILAFDFLDKPQRESLEVCYN